jgi:hypothetical protein
VSRKNEKQVVFARVAPALHDEVRIRAAIERRTVSALVRDAVARYLAAPFDTDSAPVGAGEPTE